MKNTKKYKVGYYCQFIYNDFITIKTFKNKNKAKKYLKIHNSKNMKLFLKDK